MKKFTQIAGLAGFILLGLGTFVGIVQQRMGPVVLVHLILGLGLVVLGIIANTSEIKEVLTKRSVRMGPQMVLQGTIILVVLILLNIIVYRNDIIKDMTMRDLYTLSKATISVGENLPGEVEVMAFFPGGGPNEVRQRLTLYGNKFEYINMRFIDPDKNEEIARAEAVPPESDD